MGCYVYESHMGGLFTSDEPLDYEETYCETCGDSDRELGYFNSMQDFWDYIEEDTDTFDGRKCINCPHDEDYDYCNNECEMYAKSGGYSIKYIMDFMFSNFESVKKPHYVYLVARPKKKMDSVCVKCKVGRYEFGEKHKLISAPCINGDYVEVLALSLTSLIRGNCSEFREVAMSEKKDRVNHIFECAVNRDEYCDDTWLEGAWNDDGDWYGFVDIDGFKWLDNEKWFEKYLGIN